MKTKNITFILIIVLFSLLLSVENVAQTKKRKVTKTPTNTKKTTKSIPVVVETSADVSVNEDKFSGKRTVTLSSQEVSSQLSFSINQRFDIDDDRSNENISFDFFASKSLFKTSRFSIYVPSLKFKGDAEFNFIVDRLRVKGGEIVIESSSVNQNGKETFYSYMSIGNLEKVAKGSKVEMKFADEVFTLSQEIKKNLRVFVKSVKK
jgi:hypothetical protein